MRKNGRKYSIMHGFSYEFFTIFFLWFSVRASRYDQRIEWCGSTSRRTTTKYRQLLQLNSMIFFSWNAMFIYMWCRKKPYFLESRSCNKPSKFLCQKRFLRAFFLKWKMHVQKQHKKFERILWLFKSKTGTSKLLLQFFHTQGFLRYRVYFTEVMILIPWGFFPIFL